MCRASVSVANIMVVLFTIGANSMAPPSRGELVGATKETVKYAASPQDRVRSYTRDISDFAQFKDLSKEPQKNFARAEVAKCDGEDGRPIYLIFSEGVYDVTDFVDFHPAGPEPIKKHSGEDVTKLMRATAMPPWVYDQLLGRFRVGSVVD